MDRILILMSAVEYADAQTALYSAKENAAEPGKLSFGIALAHEPDDEAQGLMAALGRIRFLCPESDIWHAMPEIWQGEGYVLMAHPAMRFTRGWDKALMKELRACPGKDDMQSVLTGFLPVREDPLDAVCTVGADAFTVDGELTFRHGTPLKYTTGAERGPFLHEDFVFAAAGFFQSMAEKSDVPRFLRAFEQGWHIYTLSRPVIRLVWDVPVQPCRVPAEHPQCEVFAQLFGVDFRTGTLSAQSRRGMLNEELNFRLRVPMTVRLRERIRLARQTRLQSAGRLPQPLCVTLCPSDMPEESMRWLRRLAGLKHLPLLAYADPLLLRKMTDFLPNVMEFKARYMMDLPVDAPQVIRTLSKASILARARDRELTHSHYIWLDADCVQAPLYAGTVFRWENVCADKIVIAMVNGEPDPTMFCVPDALVLPLAREIEARCLACLSQRGDLPAETEMWQMLIREHPDWFRLRVTPVKRQLFTLLTTEDD